MIVGENWIKVRLFPGLTSAGSVSVCAGSSDVLEVFLEEFEMLFFPVLKQEIYLCISKQGGVLSGCIVL